MGTKYTLHTPHQVLQRSLPWLAHWYWASYGLHQSRKRSFTSLLLWSVGTYATTNDSESAEVRNSAARNRGYTCMRKRTIPACSKLLLSQLPKKRSLSDPYHHLSFTCHVYLCHCKDIEPYHHLSCQLTYAEYSTFLSLSLSSLI